MNKIMKKYSTVLIIILTIALLAGCSSKPADTTNNNNNAGTIQRYGDIPAALTELINGGVDAVVADSPVVLEFLANNPSTGLTAFGDESFEKEFYGIAMRQQDTEIHELINEGLERVIANGVYDKIFNNYFGDGTEYVVEEGENTLGITIKAGADMAYAPFEYVNDKGQPEGFDMDLIRAIGAEMGFKVELINTNWDGIIPSLIAGNIDLIISAMTITEKRQETVTFSNPYFEATQYIAVKEGSTIKSLEDLKGKKIGVQNGTTGDIAITNYLEGQK
ncbi:transporter substrate-binding domain-containing protein [Serpentinicella alkaliphila]|uniref:Extracellular solute-binding protein (Family 3) n=2 Tax=Serpentinicella alkaliphila TaxID=1734049 RepID=A0A4R2TKZ0_9FIRM|nr:transporter substrate-binding domain-containing protein [Serpentinicella alkaliphila]TCQ03092.1 extracellular solute-binding protein (family 3) [Serpentinicella alkaliphila]